MTVTRLHPGAVETFQATDAPGYYPSATIVGAAPQWDDASDATYARSQTDTVSTDWRSVVARLDPLPAEVTLDKIVGITSHIRFDTAHPDGEERRQYRLQLWDYAHRSSADSPAFAINSTSVAYPDPPDDDLIYEVDYLVYPNPAGPFVDPDAVLAALHSGAWMNWAYLMPSPWKRGALTVYETWIDVEFLGSSVVRQWPRDDSRGINAVTRVYPPPRGGRVIGGQP